MRSLVAAAALLLAFAGQAQSELIPTSEAESQPPQLNPVLAERLAKEQRLQDLGWALAHANVKFCQETAPSIGLQLLDMASFRQPDLIRRELGLERDFAILSVANGSPAARAGMKPLQPITHINGFDLESWEAARPLNWERTEQAQHLLSSLLLAHGEVTLDRPEKTSLSVKGEQICATRFELTGGDDIALADGERVRLSAGYPAFAYPDDELAAVIAHELAHNVLSHRAWLDTHGRKRKHVRMTEREADRLAPWLLANAGFEPEAALRFMRRWGPEHGGGIFRKRTHEGWDERAEHIAAEIPLVLQALKDDDYANWKTRFKREISPQ